MTQAVQVPITPVALTGSDVGPWSTVWTAGDTADVTVWIKAPGVAAVLVDSGDLTVTGAEPLVSGYDVQISLDLVGGDEWTEGSFAYLVRTTPTGQTASIGASNAVPLAVIEAALDRLSRQTQDRVVEERRAVKVPLGETLDDLPDAATRAGSVLAFDDAGQPDASKTYAQLVLDIAGAIEPDVLAAIAAAGDAEIAAIAFAGQAAAAAILVARDNGLSDIADAASAGATALGLPTGGIIDIIPASEGYDEGFALTDMNGWTIPAWYFDNTGVVGDVVRIKSPTGDFSGLASALRIYVPPPILAADYTIVFWVGQSDASSQDAVPMPDLTPSPFAAMLDTMKPTAWSGAFGTAFATAEGSEYIFSTTQHQGTTFPWATALQLERLIEARDGEVYGVDHTRKVLFVQVGLSSSDVPGFSYPSAHFTKVIDWATAVAAAAALEGKTARVEAIIWAGWGAFAYQNGQSQATVESRIDSYCGAAGSIATYILPIFGQTGEVIPVGICGDAHHFQGSDPITPQVADAERALIAAQPTRYFYALNKNNYHLNGANLGWGASTSHQHPDEEEEMSGPVADFLHSKITRDGATWHNFVPTAAMFTRPAADELLLTIPSWPAGANFGFRSSGQVTSYGAQDCHGWFLCDPSTPTVEIAQIVSPFQWDTPGQLKFKAASALPTPVEVRYACRTASSSLGGNTVIKFDTPDTVPVRGVAKDVVRTLPTLKLQVA